MFEIGERVVCVYSSKQPHTVEELNQDVPNWVKEGETYSVRGIMDADFVVGLYLEEIHNPPKYFKAVGKVLEPSFLASRFEKMATKEIKTEKYEFTEI